MGDPEYQKRHGMKTIESRIINIHGSLSSDEEFDEDIQEMQELVVGTNTLPEADWGARSCVQLDDGPASF
jgi:hypothetical protein